MNPLLKPHTVFYVSRGEWRARTIDLSKGRDEVIAAILRDERDAVSFVEEGDCLLAERMKSPHAQARRVPSVTRGYGTQADGALPT